jgi:pimeloyl-ACP methyl ester carboxylesterase
VGEFHALDWGGAGPLLHVAHATGFCAAVYGPLAERLTPSLRVVGLDDRGHGRSTVPADPRALHDWQIFADDLAGVFRQLGEPVIALGHSRGGVASLMTAARHPALVKALVLIDPTILPLGWMWWWHLAKKTGLAGYAPIAFRAARRREVWPNRQAILDSYRAKLPFRNWRDEFLRAYVHEGTRETADGRVVWRCHPAWEARCFAVCPNVWQEVPRVTCPVLAIYGRDSDTFLAPAAARFERLLPSARMVALERTGHFVPMERPDETVDAILSFLRDWRLLG